MGEQDLLQRRYHRRIRLASALYAQRDSICSITIAVNDRRTIFLNPYVANAAVDVLRAHAAQTNVSLYAYRVMPDHVHLVVAPSPTCDLVTLVGQFKNLAQRAAWRSGVGGVIWQKSFWDHFLRADEQLEAEVSCVLANPVRRGLVKEGSDYRFDGTLTSEVQGNGGGQAPALL